MREEQTDRELRPLTNIQRAQTREFIRELEQDCQTYWDMVEVGDTLSRELHLTPELIILYSDGVEDFNPWYEAWRMNSWHIEGESPFGERHCAAAARFPLHTFCPVRSHQALCYRLNSHLSRFANNSAH